MSQLPKTQVRALMTVVADWVAEYLNTGEKVWVLKIIQIWHNRIPTRRELVKILVFLTVGTMKVKEGQFQKMVELAEGEAKDKLTAITSTSSRRPREGGDGF